MWRDVALVIVGAIVGAVVSVWYNAFRASAHSFFRRRRRDKREREEASGTLTARILAHYSRRKGGVDELYKPAAVGVGAVLPGLVAPDMMLDLPAFPDDSGFVELGEGGLRKFDADTRLIRKRQREGVRIFDGEIL